MNMLLAAMWPRTLRQGVLLGCAIGALVAMLGPGARAAGAFPSYPSTCPIVDRLGFYGSWVPNCLVDEGAFLAPSQTTWSNARSPATMSISPEIVRYGERFKVTIHSPYPPCQQDGQPTPTGCFDRHTGFSGLYLRLLPDANPEFVRPPYYSTVRQAGTCYAPTSCTFWFVRPPAPSTEANLTSHWIVGLMQMTLEIGVFGSIQNPARIDTFRVEEPLRLCASSKPCVAQVSGNVTQQGGSGQGVADVTVDAGCSGGGSTITDAAGGYSFLLPPGPCAISPRPPQGSSATPKRRVVHVGNNAIGGVNFQVSCSPSSTGSGGAANECPLKAFLKVVGPIADVGTRSGLSVDNLDPTEGPVNFTVGSFSKTMNPIAEPFAAGQRCVSGCANLLLTVIDPATGQPPSQPATVDARLGQIDTANAPRLQQRGTQILCAQSEIQVAEQCGTSLTGLKTDASGQLHLIYWAPGEMVKAHSSVDVTVTPTCTQSSCPGGGKPATVTADLAVKPYLIYHNTKGEIPVKELEVLMQLFDNLGIFDLKTFAIHTILERDIEFLYEQELIAEKAVELISGPYGYAAFGLIDVAQAWGEVKEEDGIASAFLKATGLSATGLFDEPFEKQIPVAPNPALIQMLIAGGGNFLHIGTGSILKTLGETLIEQQHRLHRTKPVPEQVRLAVYETSNCNEVNPTFCGTGYAASPGIKPELCFHISFFNSLPGGTYDVDGCISQYDPIAWTDSQRQGLNTSLP